MLFLVTVLEAFIKYGERLKKKKSKVSTCATNSF